MTRPPDYIVRQVDEKEVTVDWFFARGWSRHRITQFALIIVGWFFAILPVVITLSALVYRDNPARAWWHYAEGYRMWELAMLMLGFLIAVFITGFLILYLINRRSAIRRDQGKTYDTERLSRRLELAAEMYDTKYGDEAFRLDRKRVVIEPYQDLETYELRDHYREYGVD